MRAILMAMLLTLFGAAPGWADVYTVRGVPVDATAASVAEARDLAIAQGQLAAAQLLFERLTLPEDRFLAPDIDEGTASLLVAGFEVADERQSSDRYLATMTVSFDPNQVRGFLRASGAYFVESRARPFVVFPVLTGGGDPLLWRDNPWREAWADNRHSDELAALISPTGDLQEIVATPANAVVARNQRVLRAAIERYGVDRALVAQAREVSGGLAARIIEIDFASGGAEIDHGSVRASSYPALAAAVSAELQNKWKRQAVVRTDITSQIELSVLYRTQAEWLLVKNALGNAALVDNAQLDALTSDGALMTVIHRGAPEQLMTVLGERGVALVEGPDGIWRAYPRSGPMPAFRRGGPPGSVGISPSTRQQPSLGQPNTSPANTQPFGSRQPAAAQPSPNTADPYGYNPAASRSPTRPSASPSTPYQAPQTPATPQQSAYPSPYDTTPQTVYEASPYDATPATSYPSPYDTTPRTVYEPSPYSQQSAYGSTQTSSGELAPASTPPNE